MKRVGRHETRRRRRRCLPASSSCSGWTMAGAMSGDGNKRDHDRRVAAVVGKFTQHTKMWTWQSDEEAFLAFFDVDGPVSLARVYRNLCGSREN